MTARDVTFYGASDDLVEVEDAAGGLTEEYNIYNSSWSCVLEDTTNGNTAIVYVTYQREGCWTATLGLYEEGYKLPDWNPRLVQQHDYGVGLVLSLPETVVLTETKA